MKLEGIVRNGVIVPDDPAALPEGTRVRITAAPAEAAPVEEKPDESGMTFGERFAEFRGAISAPPDLAMQHEHYRLGTPKR